MEGDGHDPRLDKIAMQRKKGLGDDIEGGGGMKKPSPTQEPKKKKKKQYDGYNDITTRKGTIV